LFLSWFWFDYPKLEKKHCFPLIHKTEYVVITSTSTQALWPRKFLEEIGENKIQPTMIYCDNVCAIMLAKNLVYHNMTNHFNMKYHFIIDLVQKKDIELKHNADIFTKATPKPQSLALQDTILNSH